MLQYWLYLLKYLTIIIKVWFTITRRKIQNLLFFQSTIVLDTKPVKKISSRLHIFSWKETYFRKMNFQPQEDTDCNLLDATLCKGTCFLCDHHCGYSKVA